MKLQGRELIEILPLEELYTVYQEHERLEVFATKGRKCVTCPRQGNLLIVTQEKTNKHGHIGRIHVDLYTDDFVLMTVDHIDPFSLSKDNTLNNKQPMCDPCNNSKGCKAISNEELARRRQNAYTGLRMGIEAIYKIVPNIHTLLGDEQWMNR